VRGGGKELRQGVWGSAEMSRSHGHGPSYSPCNNHVRFKHGYLLSVYTRRRSSVQVLYSPATLGIAAVQHTTSSYYEYYE